MRVESEKTKIIVRQLLRLRAALLGFTSCLFLFVFIISLFVAFLWDPDTPRIFLQPDVNSSSTIRLRRVGYQDSAPAAELLSGATRRNVKEQVAKC
jgi:hypothetical protein